MVFRIRLLSRICHTCSLSVILAVILAFPFCQREDVDSI